MFSSIEPLLDDVKRARVVRVVDDWADGHATSLPTERRLGGYLAHGTPRQLNQEQIDNLKEAIASIAFRESVPELSGLERPMAAVEMHGSESSLDVVISARDTSIELVIRHANAAEERLIGFTEGKRPEVAKLLQHLLPHDAQARALGETTAPPIVEKPSIRPWFSLDKIRLLLKGISLRSMASISLDVPLPSELLQAFSEAKVAEAFFVDTEDNEKTAGLQRRIHGFRVARKGEPVGKETLRALKAALVDPSSYYVDEDEGDECAFADGDAYYLVRSRNSAPSFSMFVPSNFCSFDVEYTDARTGEYRRISSTSLPNADVVMKLFKPIFAIPRNRY